MRQHLENVITQDAKASDASAIRQLAIDANIDAWSEHDYLDEISRSNSFVLKATDHGELVGFLVARIVPGATERPDVDIYNIAVLPARKRQGIGSRLLGTLLEKAAVAGIGNIWLEVRESNAEAISFYELRGFIAQATRPNFYTNPIENAVIMGLQIGTGRDVSEA